MLPDTFTIIKELGRGKSGISYLAIYKNREVIIKEMHDETVPYYTFSKQKLELEISAYEILQKQKIRIPVLIEYDRNENYIVKEYVPGYTITDKIIIEDLNERAFFELLKWESELKENNINIDYFPSNFIINETGVYYIDYEINPYTEQWNFRNWGIYYWLNGNGFKLFKETKDPAYINIEGTGIPIKNLEIEKKRTLILQLYDKSDLNPPLR